MQVVRFFIIGVFLLFGATLVRGESLSSDSSDVIHTKDDSLDAASPTPAVEQSDKSEDVEPTPEGDSGIEPLDPWAPIEALPTPEPEKVEPTKGGEAVQSGTRATPSPTPMPHRPIGALIPDENLSPLKKDERTRVNKILEKRDLRARMYRRKIREQLHHDPRGQTEVRICALNLNNYGLKTEVMRLMKAKAAHSLKRRERAIVDGIIASNCDIIALQGLIGRSLAFAKEGLDALSEALTKKGKKPWKGILAQSQKELGFNAFLIRAEKDAPALFSSLTHRDLAIAPWSPNDTAKFARSPFEAIVRVPKKDGEGSREIVLLNVHLQRTLVPGSGESELYRVQMAEVVRELALQRERDETTRTPFDPPIVIVLGDIVGNERSAAARTLMGSLRQSDFGEGGNCKIELKPIEEKSEEAETPAPEKKGKAEKGKKVPLHEVLECQERPEHLKVFFWPYVEEAMPETKPILKVEGEEKKWLRTKPDSATVREFRRRREVTEAILLFQIDLPLARRSEREILHYNAGIVEIKNDLVASPLTWIDLNW